eukprot:TRINITY_DN11598_c0_g1_i1.p1 TRINITY_DN11598_c0_g1~~TRINITY_DN11598_c0_g1_i1.p1  ORF type:complete len:391 (-),score=96.05 TRINITY_DN11598_c0_g1_i1:105-1277(-)
MFSRLLLSAAFVASLTSAQICNLIVPANPLSAAGLATPFQLTTPTPNPSGNVCDQTNANTQAFVQGAIINTDTGVISVYNPLVINFNTTALIAPTAPALPGNRVVALWFGFNGNTLTLQNAAGTTSLTQGVCVNGIAAGSIFGQFSYCNAPQFFASAKNAIARGQLAVPALGNAVKGDGKVCPTVRDWMIIDMDQSDNVLTTYLMSQGKFAQNTAANQAAITGMGQTFTVISNPSDNALLTQFIYPAIGCTAWTVPDLANANAPVNALPLNEIQAQYLQSYPQALVPLNHVQAKVNGVQSLAQVNLYRKGVFQPTAAFNGQADPQAYCTNFNTIGGPRLLKNQAALTLGTSPTAANANLFDFLQTRFRGAIGPAANGGLGCDAFGITSVV